MLFNVIVSVCALVLTACLFYCIGRKAGSDKGYWKGRKEGWNACENLVIERMVKSKNIDLTKREILDEFIQ